MKFRSAGRRRTPFASRIGTARMVREYAGKLLFRRGDD